MFLNEMVFILENNLLEKYQTKLNGRMNVIKCSVFLLEMWRSYFEETRGGEWLISLEFLIFGLNNTPSKLKLFWWIKYLSNVYLFVKFWARNFNSINWTRISAVFWEIHWLEAMQSHNGNTIVESTPSSALK